MVGTSTTDITTITDTIHDLGVEIESSEMMRRRHVQPFNHFFLQGTEDMDARGTDEVDPGAGADTGENGSEDAGSPAE